MLIDTIMIFAAGKGTRMGELTLNTHKSLIHISNKAILYHVLDLVTAHGFKKIIVNTHHLCNQVEDAIRAYSKDIIIIREKELLETGGGVKNAREVLGNKPIFTINSDCILKSKIDIFHFLEQSWHPEKMDFLLLMQDMSRSYGHKGSGDFNISTTGALEKSNDISAKIYSGLQILKTEIIYKNQLDIFSLRDYYFDSKYKIFGVESDELFWYHATKQEDIMDIEEAIQEK